MDTITQLTPIQAWLIGAIDQGTLFDLIADDPAACREYGLILIGTDAAGTYVPVCL